MTGLENIIKHIEDDAKNNAAEMITAAKDEAKKRIDDANTESKRIIDEFKEVAEKKAKETILRATSASELELKKSVLIKKQEIINELIRDAKKELEDQNTEDYFDFLGKLVSAYAQDKEGHILLSEKDKNNITKSFKKILKEHNLEIIDKSMENSGFILIYGSIEINCTFDAIFDAYNEEFLDLLNTFLFEKEGGI